MVAQVGIAFEMAAQFMTNELLAPAKPEQQPVQAQKWKPFG